MVLAWPGLDLFVKGAPHQIVMEVLLLNSLSMFCHSSEGIFRWALQSIDTQLALRSFI